MHARVFLSLRGWALLRKLRMNLCEVLGQVHVSLGARISRLLDFRGDLSRDRIWEAASWGAAQLPAYNQRPLSSS